MPRPGATSSEITSTPLAMSTITGPVGSLATLADSSAPPAPAAPPRAAASSSMGPRRDVHWRAAAAGITSVATMRMTPTVWSPTTTTVTSSSVSRISRRRMG